MVLMRVLGSVTMGAEGSEGKPGSIEMGAKTMVLMRVLGSVTMGVEGSEGKPSGGCVKALTAFMTGSSR